MEKTTLYVIIYRNTDEEDWSWIYQRNNLNITMEEYGRRRKGYKQVELWASNVAKESTLSQLVRFTSMVVSNEDWEGWTQLETSHVPDNKKLFHDYIQRVWTGHAVKIFRNDDDDSIIYFEVHAIADLPHRYRAVITGHTVHAKEMAL